MQNVYNAYNDQPSARKLAAIGVAALFHVLLVYGLLHGLGTKVMTILRPPPDVHVVIEKTRPPEPVDPPPVPKNTVVPPTPVIPMPDITPPANVEPTIQNFRRDMPADPIPAVPAMPANDGVQHAGSSRVPAVVDFSTCTKPEYPRNAARMGQEGAVTLQFLIGIDGRVVESRIDKSSGSRELDRTAQQALAQCQFKPALIGGKPQQSWTSVQYVWRLD